MILNIKCKNLSVFLSCIIKMINVSSTNAIILDFLSKYPESIRKLCAEAILVYGVQTIKNKFPYGLSSHQLISIAGLKDDDPRNRISSSCNNSVTHNKSIDINKVLANKSKNTEKTERFRDLTKTQSGTKAIKRNESEKNLRFTNGLKEPEICPYETAQNFFVQQKNEEFRTEKEVMKIAEDFLKNSYASHLSLQAQIETYKPSRYFFSKKNDQHSNFLVKK